MNVGFQCDDDEQILSGMFKLSTNKMAKNVLIDFSANTTHQ